MIRILDAADVSREEILSRNEPTSNVSDIVSGIIAKVRAEGDAALKELTARFDKVELEDLRVSEAEIDEALGLVEPEFLGALARAATNIRTFHEAQVREGFSLKREDGVVVGDRKSTRLNSSHSV